MKKNNYKNQKKKRVFVFIGRVKIASKRLDQWKDCCYYTEFMIRGSSLSINLVNWNVIVVVVVYGVNEKRKT